MDDPASLGPACDLIPALQHIDSPGAGNDGIWSQESGYANVLSCHAGLVVACLESGGYEGPQTAHQCSGPVS